MHANANHVLPVKIYLRTWGALLVLTGVTIGASLFDFGKGNLVVALLIASVKASLVAAVFMHLAFGQKLNALVLGVSVMFLGLLIAFTLVDEDSRSGADPLEGEHPAQIESPFAAGKPVIRGQKKLEAPAEIPVPLLP